MAALQRQTASIQYLRLHTYNKYAQKHMHGHTCIEVKTHCLDTLGGLKEFKNVNN